MYRFRVRAENVHGLSEPGVASEEVHISLGSAVAATKPLVAISEETTTDSSTNIDTDGSEQFHVQPGGDFKSRFEVQEELGKGRFGIVFKVVERESGQVLAAKIVKCIKAKDKLLVYRKISFYFMLS